jgi:hypothetical protein
MSSSGFEQEPILPFQSCTPRIPNTSKNNNIISITFNRLGMDYSKELTTVLIPKIRNTKINLLIWLVLTFIFTDNTKGSECPQCSKSTDKGNIEGVDALQDPCQNGEEHNNEIKNIPAVLQVSVLANIEAQHDDFHRAFDDENNRNNCKH